MWQNCIGDFLNYSDGRCVSGTHFSRGEDGCKGRTMQSGHDEHRLGRHFGLLYSRRVTWQENHESPWPSKIGIVWCYLRDNHYILTFILRRVFSFFVVFFSFLAFFLSSFPIKNSKLVSSTSTFGSSSTASLFFASVLSGILRGFYAFRRRWLFLGLWFLVWSFLPAVLWGLWHFFSQ